MNPILSIIIPTYNVEKYIRECLESIVHQPNDDNSFEVIIVDDGSPDQSGEIADEYAAQYDFVSVVHQINGGLSNARNNGIMYSKGEYIWFVDSDDWIDNSAIKIIVDTISQTKPQAIGIESVRVKDCIYSKGFNFRNNLGSTSGMLLLKNIDYSGCAPFTIYRRDFLDTHNLNFYEGIFHEDTEFTPRAYYYLDTIALVHKPLYYVRYNPTSITRAYNSKKNFDILLVIESLEKFRSKVEGRSAKKIYSRIIAQAFNSAFNNTHLMSEPEFDRFIKGISPKGLRHFILSLKPKYVIEYFLLLINKKMFVMKVSTTNARKAKQPK